MRPLLSIIIPTLNEENYLPKLLEDLKGQTEKNFEVIVVDAHSYDNTKKKAYEFKDTLALNFFLSTKKNVSIQRNFGASKAKSEYLFFLDADTRISSDAIEKLVKHIKNENKVLYLPIIVSSNSAILYNVVTNVSVNLVRLLQKVGKPLSVGANIVIQKKLFDSLGGFDYLLAMAEDHNLIIKAYKRGVKAQFLPDVRCVCSMRRLEHDGFWITCWKYLYFSIKTMFKGGIYSTSLQYEMGGHNFQRPSVVES